MKSIKILDLVPGLVAGVEVQLPTAVKPYRETYFEWSGSSLTAQFATQQISGGVLCAWHHLAQFSEIETHIDAEMFYFVHGVAIMLFMDLADGRPNLETAQIVRIQPGTQIVIPVGKAHFVAVAEGDEPLEMIVVSPKMDAPRMSLPEPVEGIA
jgi:mannose-6-phosphate isomerase-like protein (cupin superfamily)